MSEQQYAWLQALVMVVRRQQMNDNPEDPLSFEMMEVTGVAGRFAKYERRSANDQIVAAFILLLVFAWNCAKYRANSVNSQADFCKINAAPIFWLLGCIPHEIWRAGQSPLLCPQCQYEHPPTRAADGGPAQAAGGAA